MSMCGGHPGLLNALLDIANDHASNPAPLKDLEWLSRQPKISEECRKLWEGLMYDERLGVLGVAKQVEIPPAVLETLLMRGLVRSQDGRDKLFTPLLAAYTLRVGPELALMLRLDSANHTVFVGSRPIHDLSNLEFKLLEFLHQRVGNVCKREEIMQAVYGDPGEGSQDSRLDRLVNRLREAIEPDQNNPRFLITVRGVGFRLDG